MAPSVALDLVNITKRFGTTTALERASLSVRSETVHALLGENGAGKTTLMRIAFGLIAADAGTVTVDGIRRRFASPADAIRAGVGMVQQHFALVGAMTVAENVALGLSRGGRYDAKAAKERVRALSAETALSLDPSARVEDLTVEAQQRVEIVKALARDAHVLILDEPTAVLAPEPAAALLRWLRKFADAGHTVVFITHTLREALSIADDVTVLRHGQTVLAARAADVSEDGLARAMLGKGAGHDPPLLGPRTLGAAPTPRVQPDLDLNPTSIMPPSRVGAGRDRPPEGEGEAVIVAINIELADDRGRVVLRDASFTIHAGEIVGIAAIEGGGAGQHELLRAIAGRRGIVRGSITRPSDVGFIPEDRQRDALALDLPLYENIALRGAGRAHGRMRWSTVRERTRMLLSTFDIRASNESVAARTLSGGNQQRLVLAREMRESVALVAENATRGLDLNAMAAIHARLRAARDAGAAIVLYASDIDETLALADRVLILAGGTMREAGPPLDRDEIGRAMLALA